MANWLDVQAHKTGWLLGNMFFFWPSEDAEDAYICLAYEQWPSMRYGDVQAHLIDYPGEYDVQWYGIECRSAAHRLHYVVAVQGKRIALVQDPAVVMEEDSERIDIWYCTSPDCLTAIENMELEGETVLLETSDDQ